MAGKENSLESFINSLDLDFIDPAMSPDKLARHSETTPHTEADNLGWTIEKGLPQEDKTAWTIRNGFHTRLDLSHRPRDGYSLVDLEWEARIPDHLRPGMSVKKYLNEFVKEMFADIPQRASIGLNTMRSTIDDYLKGSKAQIQDESGRKKYQFRNEEERYQFMADFCNPRSRIDSVKIEGTRGFSEKPSYGVMMYYPRSNYEEENMLLTFRYNDTDYNPRRGKNLSTSILRWALKNHKSQDPEISTSESSRALARLILDEISEANQKA